MRSSEVMYNTLDVAWICTSQNDSQEMIIKLHNYSCKSAYITWWPHEKGSWYHKFPRKRLPSYIIRSAQNCHLCGRCDRLLELSSGSPRICTSSRIQPCPMKQCDIKPCASCWRLSVSAFNGPLPEYRALSLTAKLLHFALPQHRSAFIHIHALEASDQFPL
jgi:hypothetical protein